jgi:aminoglycoside/choline kinase family phosphotransferase
MKETMEIRMVSISELQRLERDIKLIGDWYSARFYELAAAKFKIDEWRRTIRSKLESLEDTYSLVVENFTVSAKHRAEWVQIIAFFVLQIGWLFMLVIEILRFLRKS